jgi:hypothetical protein
LATVALLEPLERRAFVLFVGSFLSFRHHTQTTACVVPIRSTRIGAPWVTVCPMLFSTLYNERRKTNVPEHKIWITCKSCGHNQNGLESVGEDPSASEHAYHCRLCGEVMCALIELSVPEQDEKLRGNGYRFGDWVMRNNSDVLVETVNGKFEMFVPVLTLEGEPIPPVRLRHRRISRG